MNKLMNDRPRFITLEGGEAVGKSTVLHYIHSKLEALGVPVVITREPGGAPIAEAIRDILLSPEFDTISDYTELLLIFAARAQHVEQIIRPALAEGKWVLSDRFCDASYVYQGAGRGLPEERIAILEEWVLQGLQPDVTILLDAPPSVSEARMKHRGKNKDRIEKSADDFFVRIRQAYLTRAKKFPERFVVVDAAQPLVQVEQVLGEVLHSLMLSNT